MSALRRFALGDTVNQKEGGPAMTVVEVEGDYITCQWFEDEDSVHERVFRAEELVRKRPHLPTRRSTL